MTWRSELREEAQGTRKWRSRVRTLFWVITTSSFSTAAIAPKDDLFYGFLKPWLGEYGTGWVGLGLRGREGGVSCGISE